MQAPQEGIQTLVYCASERNGADKVNFENGRYKDDPPAPVDAGKFYIYHNTFWGGSYIVPAFSVKHLQEKFRMVMPFFVVNNIYKDNWRLWTGTHELAGPNLLYTFPKTPPTYPRKDRRIPVLNRIADPAATERIWNRNGLPGLPDLTLAAGSPALGVGVDVSRPFTVDGKKYPALPGFKPGYFKGKAPAAGALQEGESMARFIHMYRRTEAAVKMLNDLKAGTAAETKGKGALK